MASDDRAVRFAPDCLTGAEWELAGPPLRLAAAAAQPTSVEDWKGLLSRGALFLSRRPDWDRTGTPDLPALLGTEALTANGELLCSLGYSSKTRENHRADLRRLARAAHGLPPRAARRTAPAPMSQPAPATVALTRSERTALQAAVAALDFDDPGLARPAAAVFALELGAGLPTVAAEAVRAGQVLLGGAGSGVATGRGLRPVHTDAAALLQRAVLGLAPAALLAAHDDRSRVVSAVAAMGLEPGLLDPDRLALSWLVVQLSGPSSLPLLDAALLAGGDGLTRRRLESVLPQLPLEQNPATAALLLSGTLAPAERRPPPRKPHPAPSPAKKVSPRWDTRAPAETGSAGSPAEPRPVSRAAARRAAREALARSGSGTQPTPTLPAPLTPAGTRPDVPAAPAWPAPPTPPPVAVNSAAVTAAIDEYASTTLPREAWVRLAPLARLLLHAKLWPSRRRAVEAANHVAAFLAWAERRPGRPDPDGPLSVGELLLPGLLTTYIGEGLAGGKPGTRATKRSVLGAVLAEVDPHPAEKIPYRKASPPYSPAEAAAKKRQALHQPTAARRAQLCATVGLGFGAGLNGRSLRGIRPVDVDELTLPDGTVVFEVTVQQPEPRRVTVRADCVPLVREALAAHAAAGRRPKQPLLGRADRRNVTNPAVDRAVTATDAPVEVDTARLRSTWLVALMAEHVPVALILAAAGLRSARALTDLLPYVPLPDPGTAAALLSGRAGQLLPARLPAALPDAGRPA